jgi:hypothetical protein
MAAINSDSKRTRPLTPAASTRKRVSTVTFQDIAQDVYVREEEGK